MVALLCVAQAVFYHGRWSNSNDVHKCRLWENFLLLCPSILVAFPNKGKISNPDCYSKEQRMAGYIYNIGRSNFVHEKPEL